jgi:transposase-like protein
MSKFTSLYKRHRFPPEIVQHAVWLYHRFNLSARDIEDLLAERGISVSYESIRLWCIKFGPDTPGDSGENIQATATLSSLMKSS